MSRDAYNTLKNFIHNECGVSKEDIRGMIQSAISPMVEKEVKKYFDGDQFSHYVTGIAKVAMLAAIDGGQWDSESVKKDLQSKIRMVIAQRVAEAWEFDLVMKQKGGGDE